MKIYKEIIQGTEEWHQIKYRKIGGSTSKGLFVESDTLLISILSQFLEPFELEEDGYINSDMQRGIELEPLGRERLGQYAGVNFIEVGWVESSLISVIGISPDGMSECETVMCEIKCPAKEKHTKTLFSNEIPSDNIHQCLHYFTVNPKLETFYFASFRPESNHPLFVKKLNRKSVVNLGTEKTPKIKTVDEWVKIATGNAYKLEADIQSAIKKLEF